MQSITLSCTVNDQFHTIVLDNHNKETFLKEVAGLYEGVSFTDIEIEDISNIPDVFRFPSVTENILVDSFWSWKMLNEDDRKLFVYYIEITQDDQKTIEEARDWRNKKRSFLRA